MHIHLIGGFLGSGKTTAIQAAIEILSAAGEKVAVITNDQGDQLVDTRFVQQQAFAAAQVTGGCFCCNYHDLDTQIKRLENEVRPGVIFAETVGSCTDLVATVLKPLLQFREQLNGTIIYSVFVDAELLMMHLHKQALPFLPETNYIWEKQLEEADILVINKCDLLTASKLESLKQLAIKSYPEKNLLFQNSLDMDSVKIWLDKTGDVSSAHPRSIEIDYPTYAVGEANLAWLDVDLEFFTGNLTAGAKATALIQKLQGTIRQKEFPIGHLKFFVVSDGEAQKISFTNMKDQEADLNIKRSNTVQVLVNARVQTQPDMLQDMLETIINEVKQDGDVIINQKNLSCFKPGYPSPAYRMA